MMLSKSGIHAVRALMVLAELPEGTYAGAVSIAERIGAPKNYLGKILQQLSREGLLVSQKGMGGGFRLARDPKDISLLSVGATCSEDDPCPIHDRWKTVKEAYLELLTETTIADLVMRQKTVGE
jgi:DNA-binding IscR family transcriptional regulator